MDLRAAGADEATVEGVKSGWKGADLSPLERALCAHAEKLTREPASVGPEDVLALRAAGLDDRAIHDATQVVAYFNYINRLADGLGTDLEPDMPPRPRRS